jgi:hypothetical protein
VVFQRPSTAVTFGVDAVTAQDPSAPRTRVFVEYSPTSATSLVGVSGGNAPPGFLTQYMNHTDLPGGDYNVTNVVYTDPRVCQVTQGCRGQRNQAPQDNCNFG